MAYFAGKKIGGNMLTIQAVHILDAASSVHGELTETGADDWHCVLGNLIPEIEISGEERKLKKNTPDQIVRGGKFAPSGGFATAPWSGLLIPHARRRAVQGPAGPAMEDLRRERRDRAHMRGLGRAAGVSVKGASV